MMTDGWPNGRWIRDTMDEGDGRETLARRRNREKRGADGLVMVVVFDVVPTSDEKRR